MKRGRFGGLVVYVLASWIVAGALLLILFNLLVGGSASDHNL